MKLDYRPDIDGLRAVAVLAVIMYHLDIGFFSGGFVGVDVFFVISGFLITRIIVNEYTENKYFDYKGFFVRRIRRLFPSLFVVLLLTLVFGALVLSPARFQALGGSAWSAMISLSNFYFWDQADYFDVSAKVKPLLHTWSLGVEEQFYIFWSVVIVFFLKRLSRYILPFLMLLGLLSLLAASWFGQGHGGSWNEDGRATIFYLLPFRIFEFAIGAAINWMAVLEKGERHKVNLLYFLGAVMIVIPVFSYDESLLFPGWLALTPCMGAALLIYFGKSAFSSLILKSRLMIWIGLLSYTLYLVHWPVIVYWRYLVGDLDWLDRLGILLVTVCLSSLIYLFIEEPIRRGRFKFNPNRRRYIAGSGIAIMFVAAIHIQLNGGWSWRVSESVVFEEVGNAAEFHTKFYGGAGFANFSLLGADGPGEKPDIILMGDSHAKHYLAGLYQELVLGEGLEIYTSAGDSCIHLPGFTRNSFGVQWDSVCANAVDKAIEEIKAADNPVVIISQSWLSQLSMAAVAESNGMYRMPATVEDVISGLLRLRAMAGDIQIIIIGNVPTTRNINLYDFFSRPLLSRIRSKEKYINMHLSEDISKFNNRLKNFALKTEGFVFLDPALILCKAKKCKNLDGEGRLIYSDSTHLSIYGSRLLIHEWTTPILEAVRM